MVDVIRNTVVGRLAYLINRYVQKPMVRRCAYEAEGRGPITGRFIFCLNYCQFLTG